MLCVIEKNFLIYLLSWKNLTINFIIFTELKLEKIKKKEKLKVRDITLRDFEDSLKRIRRSVPTSTIEIYDKWNAEYGDITA